MRVKSSPRRRSARAIRSALRPWPKRVFVGDRGLDLVDDVGERAGERQAAQHLEGLVGAGEVGLGVLDDAAEVLQRGAALLQHGGDLGLDRQPAEVAAPGDPQARAGRRRGRGRTARRSTAGRAGRGPRAPAAAARRRAACARSCRAPGTGSTGRRGRRPGSGRGRGAARRGCRTPRGCGRWRRGPSRRRTGASRPRPPRPRRRSSPPGVRSRSYGLRVAPKTALNVCEPAPNSGVFVLPITIAPAARRRSTSSESCSGTCSANSGEPYVVRIPAVSSRSLTAIGRPWRTPRGGWLSASSAARSASSGSSSVTIALTRGLTSAIRSRCAAITSRAENSRARRPAASSVAVRPHTAPDYYCPVRARLRPRAARALRRVRPAGDRLQPELPGLLRPHGHRAVAGERDRQLGGDGRARPRRRRRRGQRPLPRARRASTT